MLEFLIIVYMIFLVYLSEIEVIRSYILMLAIQGLLLSIIALYELHELKPLNLAFVLIETLVFKAGFVPILLYQISKRTSIRRNNKVFLKGNASVVISTVIIILSFWIAHLLHDERLQVKYFAVAISSMLIGLYIGINHRDIISHLISFLVIENGLFMLSLALGAEMPMLVNSAILLDIFGSFLVMGLFFNKINDYFQDVQTDKLTQLKD